MYEAFFGLREAPFTLTPNTHFFMKSETHRQGLETLLVALNNKEGFIKLTGEVGTGKTLLCRKLLNALDEHYVTAYVPNPHCSPETLYCMIADELGIDCHDAAESSGSARSFTTERSVLALKHINEKLLELTAVGKQVVLIIDEAQSMPMETIEALRLLTNLETESEKLLQVILFGQPELDDMLSREELRQLRQRITFQHKLQPLTRNDVESYISHRMILAGYSGDRLFDEGAVTQLYRASGGIPRLLNVLCHKALMAAYGKGSSMVKREHMKGAIQDTESVYRKKRFKLPWQVTAWIVTVTTLGSLTGYLQMGGLLG
ncbi:MULTISPECIES: ExeA family protein [unclassified Oleiphilus]|uniref:ExeA family protein n=1 Tax=unclassified Oleiphilus TaxID=2631174 RepID=UPI000837BC8F|nr:MULTISPECIES: AAA family ATPase [unclassified Oleiphilus]